MADTSRLEIPLLALIKRRDPTFFKDRARVTEYEMSNGRAFTADPTTRGAYSIPVHGPDSIFKEETPDIGVLDNLFNE
jgi:hypothetical protein